MAEEFQAGVCGETWWNSSRNSLGLSPCQTAINNTGSFGWPSDLVDMKARTDGLILFQDIQKPQEPESGGSVFMDSTLQMIDIGRSSSSTRTTDWNKILLSGSGRSERNYHSSMVQEDMNSRLNFQQEPGMDCPQIQKEWSMKSFSVGRGQNSTINEFKQTNQGFSLDEPCLNSLTGSGNCTETSQGFPTSFPMNSVSCGNPSTLLQTLFDNDSAPQQSQFDNWSMNYPSTTNYQTNMNEFSPCLPKFSHLQRPSLPKQQPISPLHLKNSTPFWNASTAALNDIRAGFFPSTQGEFLATMFEEKTTCPNLATKPENEAVQDSGSMAKKSSIEPAFKRPRIETPSLLPTFKVRKEKLGDRITALQQLVSPFGKTDTASVLHEAIEYIKFLHDQVSVLNSPYMKNGAPTQHQQISDNLNPEAPKQDLRSRGLCLVPISSTFPVATETTADFWTPTFGGIFR